MQSLLENVGAWGIGLVALGIGLWLIAWGIIDVGGALGGKNKEWGRALLGLVIGIVGGWIGWMGSSRILSLFKSNGQEIPIK